MLAHRRDDFIVQITYKLLRLFFHPLGGFSNGFVHTTRLPNLLVEISPTIRCRRHSPASQMYVIISGCLTKGQCSSFVREIDRSDHAAPMKPFPARDLLRLREALLAWYEANRRE